MLKTKTEIQRMILKHIEDIDKEIKKHETIPAYQVELYKAKSMALQSLAELRN